VISSQSSVIGDQSEGAMAISGSGDHFGSLLTDYRSLLTDHR
jgi:hypothetical protein